MLSTNTNLIPTTNVNKIFGDNMVIYQNVNSSLPVSGPGSAPVPDYVSGRVEEVDHGSYTNPNLSKENAQDLNMSTAPDLNTNRSTDAAQNLNVSTANNDTAYVEVCFRFFNLKRKGYLFLLPSFSKFMFAHFWLYDTLFRLRFPLFL